MEISNLLQNNRSWAQRMIELDPEYFARLEHQQAPKFLWIGCSDSRVPANQITGLSPGEVFVHRNIANMVIHTDFNALSVIQYAIENLEIEHIIVCGHYGCSGIRAAMSQNSSGFVDNWLRHIKDVQLAHSETLDSIEPIAERQDRLTELNVMQQVINVAETSFVSQAWKKGQKLSIHGWVYSLADGLIRDMQVTVQENATIADLKAKLKSDRCPCSSHNS